MSDTKATSVDKQSMTALRENGGNILFVIAIALAGFFGWQYFQTNKTTSIDIVAADKFAKIQQMNQSMNILKQSISDGSDETRAIVETQSKAFNIQVDHLIANHSDSVYAWQALMLRARQQMDMNEPAAASETLKKATEIDLKDAGLKAIAQLRYAQSLLADGKIEESLSVAKQEMPSSFEASQQELFGDIYQAQGDKEQAIRAYENAWKILLERQENRSVLALKMESLGIEIEPIAIASIVEQPKVEEALALSESTEIVEAKVNGTQDDAVSEAKSDMASEDKKTVTE